MAVNPNSLNNLPAPPSQVPLVTDGGVATPAFSMWLMKLWERVGSNDTSLAPAEANYLITTANTALANAQVLANEAAGILHIKDNLGTVGTIPATSTTPQTLVSNQGTSTPAAYTDLALSSNFVVACIAVSDVNADSYNNGPNNDGVGSFLIRSSGFGAIDGVNLTAGTHVCLAGQNNAAQNGLYSIDATGTILTRITTYQNTIQINAGDSVSVTGGNNYFESIWYQIEFNPYHGANNIVGTDAIGFRQIVNTGLSNSYSWLKFCRVQLASDLGGITTFVYNNGPNNDGVGAFLFCPSGIPTINLRAPQAGDRYLIWGQTLAYQNGIYYCDDTLHYLIRDPSYDNSANGRIYPGGVVSALPGVSFASGYLLFMQTAFDYEAGHVVGTNSISFTEIVNTLTTGTVTSVGFKGDGTVLSSTTSGPITTSGNLIATLNNQTGNTILAGPSSGGTAAPTFRNAVPADFGTAISANTVLAGPSSGSAAAPTFRSLVAADIPGGTGVSSVHRQIFTASGTYTPTSGMLYADIEVVGAGGGGGGCTAVTGTGVGGGGGGGGYARKLFSAAQVGSSATITVGAAGTAGTAGNNGGTGGTSSAALTGTGTITISATGGAGGVALNAQSTFNVSAGGLGGNGSNGDINGYGQTGGLSFVCTTNTGSFGGFGGCCGFYGSGGLGYSNVAHSTNGNGYGGGGGGALCFTPNSSAGQAGAPGIVIITEYV